MVRRNSGLQAFMALPVQDSRILDRYYGPVIIAMEARGGERKLWNFGSPKLFSLLG